MPRIEGTYVYLKILMDHLGVCTTPRDNIEKKIRISTSICARTKATWMQALVVSPTSLARLTLDSGGPTQLVDIEIFTHMRTSLKVSATRLCEWLFLATQVAGKGIIVKAQQASSA